MYALRKFVLLVYIRRSIAAYRTLRPSVFVCSNNSPCDSKLPFLMHTTNH